MTKLLNFTQETCQDLSPTDTETHPEAIQISSTEHHFSTIGISPIRIVNAPGDHIRLDSSSTSFTLQGDTLHAIDATILYLNGKKIPEMEWSVTNDF